MVAMIASALVLLLETEGPVVPTASFWNILKIKRPKLKPVLEYDGTMIIYTHAYTMQFVSTVSTSRLSLQVLHFSLSFPALW